MSFRGDFQKLNRIATLARRTAEPSFLRELNKQLAEEAITQVRIGFRQSRTPYGETWKALLHRQGKPLMDTGRMRNSFSRQDVTARGFRVDTDVVYAGTHQYGSEKRSVPQRTMMPISSRGLGPIWWKAFQRVAAAMQRKLTR